MTNFSPDSGSRDATSEKWRDALAGNDRNFDCGRDYRLAEVAAERAILVGIGRLIRRAARFITCSMMVMMVAVVM